MEICEAISINREKLFGIFWSFPEKFEPFSCELLESGRKKGKRVDTESNACCHILSNDLAYSREQLSRTFRKLFNFSFFSAKFKA
jgi:hypothetical protein